MRTVASLLSDEVRAGLDVYTTSASDVTRKELMIPAILLSIPMTQLARGS